MPHQSCHLGRDELLGTHVLLWHTLGAALVNPGHQQHHSGETRVHLAGSHNPNKPSKTKMYPSSHCFSCFSLFSLVPVTTLTLGDLGRPWETLGDLGRPWETLEKEKTFELSRLRLF
jgi:hypothetical protein